MTLQLFHNNFYAMRMAKRYVTPIFVYIEEFAILMILAWNDEIFQIFSKVRRVTGLQTYDPTIIFINNFDFY